jgi:hypothetical protein
VWRGVVNFGGGVDLWGGQILEALPGAAAGAGGAGGAGVQREWDYEWAGAVRLALTVPPQVRLAPPPTPLPPLVLSGHAASLTPY